ncbi:MAG: hypothetical protein IJP53_05720 [Synergistaceae bacterium]|nr:hypothetical protein [Synergistaceae bacterium]
MGLVKCRLCGMLYESGQQTQRICRRCISRLDELYGRVHEYMRDNEDEDFDIYNLADAMDISTADVQALVDLGYIERDLQTYSKNKRGSREALAAKLNNELEKMKRTLTTYGGVVYARDKEKKSEARQYVYDSQKTLRGR